MTQKELIDKCNEYVLDCGSDCEKACIAYYNKYKTSPFFDDVIHPERYTDEEIEV